MSSVAGSDIDKENSVPLDNESPNSTPAPTTISKASKKKGSGPSKSTKASWKSGDSAMLIATLLKEREAGRQSDSGFKPTSWAACALALKGSEITSGGASKTSNSCRDHFKKVSRCRNVPFVVNVPLTLIASSSENI